MHKWNSFWCLHTQNIVCALCRESNAIGVWPIHRTVPHAHAIPYTKTTENGNGWKSKLLGINATVLLTDQHTSFLLSKPKKMLDSTTINLVVLFHFRWICQNNVRFARIACSISLLMPHPISKRFSFTQFV